MPGHTRRLLVQEDVSPFTIENGKAIGDVFENAGITPGRLLQGPRGFPSFGDVAQNQNLAVHCATGFTNRGDAVFNRNSAATLGDQDGVPCRTGPRWPIRSNYREHLLKRLSHAVTL